MSSTNITSKLVPMRNSHIEQRAIFLKQGENPCHVLLVLLGLMSAPHCTHVRAALVSIKESS